MVEKISGQNSINPVIKQKPIRKPYEVTPPVGITDEVSLSPFAKELSRVMNELERVPEVRQDKVNDLRKQIAEGTYKPDLAKVAHSLLIAGLLRDEE